MIKRRAVRNASAAVVCALLAIPARAASLIGTSTSSEVFQSATRFHVHCVNGYYWVAYHDGVKPVLASSSDGVTWTALGAVFSSFNPSDLGEWAVRFSGNNIIALAYNGADTNRYYRNGTLNSNGTVTWNAADAAAGPTGSSWPQLNALIANGKPIMWRAGSANSAQGRFRRGNQLNAPTWTDTGGDPPSLSTTTGGGFSAGAIFPTGGSDPDDLIVLRATTSSTYTAGNHRLVAVKWDASIDPNPYEAAWYNVSTLGGTLTEDTTTEVKVQTDNVGQKRFAAVRDSSGNLHAVYVNRNDDVVHYKKAEGFNDTWSRISTDVSQSALAIDKVALTAAGSNNLYLFYAKTDRIVYYRRFDGTSWGVETLLYDASATDINDALGVMESTNGCLLGLAFSEGLGPTFNVRFTLAGSTDCGELRTSQGSGTLTVTAPGSFEMVFEAVAGGSIRRFYDLAEDPARAWDLAGAAGEPNGLFNSGMVVGTSYNASMSNNPGKLDLLEATPTRVKLRQESLYRSNAGVVLAGVKGWGDYSIYPAGKTALRWNRRTTSPVTYDAEYHELVAHHTGAAPLNWTPFSETDGITPPSNPGTDDFLLAQNDSVGARTDFLDILYKDWTTANGHTETADIADWTINPASERLNLYWDELTGVALPAGASETWDFLTYFKPTSFLNNTDAAVTGRRADYRSPDALTVTVGSGWNVASENTLTDDFNEAEGAYTLTFDMAAGLSFDIDGGATTRYKPFFKIRHWRSLQDPPSVTLEGAALANDIDYHADVKPIARSYYADTLEWHSTLEAAGAVTTPDVGRAGTANGTTTFVAGKYGNGALFDAAGENVTFPGTDLDRRNGTIEFWYRPNYNHTDGVRHLFFVNFGDATHSFSLEHSLTNRLDFVIDNGGTLTAVSVTSANYRWAANEWVHIRATWDRAAPLTDQVRLFINGVEPPHIDPVNPYVFGTMVVGTSYIGSDPAGGNSASGVIDEVHLYVPPDAPTSAALGGLVGNAEEYLADGTRNFPLNFTAVGAQRQGRYWYIGSDSKFWGLNVAVATTGVAGVSPDLQWQFWNGTAWANLESMAGFTDETANLTQPDGTIYWTADMSGWSPYSVNGGSDLYYVRVYLASGSYTTPPTEGIVKTDILLFQYCGDITLNAQTFVFAQPTPTAVELVSFAARGLDGAVELTWETASELKNLGFHLYRASSAGGPYQRITATPIPGLGSSPSGARYHYIDPGLANGATYFYKLEDIETTGKTKLHGPVSATPLAGGTGSSDRASAGLTYGDPTGVSLLVVERTPRQMVLELTTPGFVAEPQPDGSVRILIPGFSEEGEPGSPEIPVRRTWLEVETGRGVRVVSVRAEEVQVFSSLRPMAAESPEVIASPRGTARAGRRRQGEGAAFRQPGLYPEDAARLVSVGYQGEAKKALLELAPLRWNRSTGELLLARRLTVRLAFSGREEARHRERGSHNRRMVTKRLRVRERGLYAVSFEEVFDGRRRGIPASSLRLSRQGEAVAFHLEPASGVFGPGSTLYFVSEGASLNPYGHEAVYELELAGAGTAMPVASGSPAGSPVAFHFRTLEREQNRYYQAGLVEAEEVWLWDLLFAPAVKSYPFELSGLAVTSEPSRLEVRLQGVSDLPESPDHHLRVSVNGTLVAESTLEGKQPLRLTADIPAGVLREGENAVEIENLGDTGASYSMVMLDRFSLRYPRRLVAEGGKLEGSFSESGVAEVEGLADALVLDVTEPPARWLGSGARFRVEAGRRYLVVSAEAVLKPEVGNASASRLKSPRNRADYLVVGPRELLGAAEPLVELRRSEGLRGRAVPIEEVYSEFGYGEPTPEAVREFLSYAYHHWQKPSPRYVLLLGDATYDFKDYLGTGVENQVPPLMVKTTYLWTVSDSAYGAVNGEDILPDLAIGRLPGKTLEEARVMAGKVLAYEASGEALSGRAVLVADNADGAGDFEADAEEIARSLLASRSPRRIYLGRLGVEATRTATVEAFDEGAGLLSYLGHGGIHLWAQENIFNSSQVSTLAPQSRQPLVLTLNCLNGYFHFPYFNSLGEELVKAEGKGAVAAFSPSGLSLNGPAQLYHKALLQELLSGKHRRLGDAVLAAQAAYADSGAFPELLRIYLLLGDPALRLR